MPVIEQYGMALMANILYQACRWWIAPKDLKTHHMQWCFWPQKPVALVMEGHPHAWYTLLWSYNSCDQSWACPS